MEESASEFELEKYKIVRILPLQRIIAILILEKIKNEFENEHEFSPLIYQNYIEYLQENCVDPNYLRKSEVNNADYQNSIKKNLSKIINSTAFQNTKIKSQINRFLTNISNEEIKAIIDDLNKIYHLANAQSDNKLENHKEFMKEVKIKNYLNILFFSCCIFIRNDIRKESFKNILEFFLLAGADINAQYFKRKRTPLLEIILNGHRGLGAILLFKTTIEPEYQKEWEIEIKSKTNYQSEKISSYKNYNKDETKHIRENHMNIVDMFLQYQANPELEDLEGFNPLLQATKLGIEEIVKLLIEKYHVNIDKQDKHGNTALIIATSYSYKEIMELLLKNHANPTIENLNKISPLKLIAHRSKNHINFKDQVDYELAKILLEHIAINQKDLLKQILQSARTLTQNQDLFDLFLQYDIYDQFEKGI